VSALQERTGKLKWMKELRERDWGDYISDLSKQIMRKEEVRLRLETYHKWVERFDGEVRMFCEYASRQFNLKHEGEGVRLVWGHKHCDNPRCGTCLGTYNTHYPYPQLISATETFKTARPKPLSVRRGKLKEFLIGECGLTASQADALFRLIDLRHLMIRRFNYEIMELKNFGVL